MHPYISRFPNDMNTLNTAVRPYSAPQIEELGAVARLTMGNGGSSLDGNCTMTQLGFGNNPSGGQNPQSCNNRP